MGSLVVKRLVIGRGKNAELEEGDERMGGKVIDGTREEPFKAGICLSSLQQAKYPS
jgi:hypothetical protein